jgi:hypothetical protein
MFIKVPFHQCAIVSQYGLRSLHNSSLYIDVFSDLVNAPPRAPTLDGVNHSIFPEHHSYRVPTILKI